MVAAGNIDITAYSDALVVLGTAGILIPIFRRWGVNSVLGYLAAGAVLGPFGLGSFIQQFPFLYWFTIVDVANIAPIAGLGIVFLLFVIGLELSFHRLLSMRRLFGGLGGLQVLVSTAVLTAAAALMAQSRMVAIILGASLSLSSTAIVLELLPKKNRFSTGSGRAVFAILLAQDLAVIPILMFVSFAASNHGESVAAGLLKSLFQAAVAVAVLVLAGRRLIGPLFRRVSGFHSTELFIALVLFAIVAAGVIAHQAGLSMSMGAFLAGMLLAETEFRKAIQASIEPFQGLLLGVFFFTVGMRVDIREIVREPLLLFGCILGLIVIKVLVLVPLARAFRLSWPDAIETGLLLGPGGEFAFIILGLAADLNLVTNRLAGFSLAVVSISMAATPGLSSLAGRIRRRLETEKPVSRELAPSAGEREARAIVVGYGRVGKVVCELLRQEQVPYIASDFDPDAVTTGRRDGHEVYFGDTSDPEFLRVCGLEDAIGVIITINAPEAIDGIVAQVRAIRHDVLIISRARDADHARHLYEIGATEAVPETIEASFQLSEAALIGLGVARDSAEAAVEEMRQEFHRTLSVASPDNSHPAA